MSTSSTQMTLVRPGSQGASTLERRRYRVEDSSGKVLIRTTDATVIGSSQAADLRIDDPAVSRLHARLLPKTSGLVLEDLGSTNGTSVGNLQLGRVVLPERGSFEVAGRRLRFAVEDSYEAADLSSDFTCGELLGPSAPMREVFARLRQFATSSAPVLIQGETGTGKELAAEAVHNLSSRADGPFVVVDCATLPATLIESELFGHERGAFTEASSTRIGAFEQADRGTLFLDEVGEIERVLQSRLLRAVETRSVQRIGSDVRRQVDVRIVAATHRDLARLVSTGDFREDLYHRLNVLPVQMPPLRERMEDLPFLARHFAQLAESKYGAISSDALSDDVLNELQKRSFPGNVRELKNLVERLVLLGPRGLAAADGMPEESYLDLPLSEARSVAVERFERAYLQRILRRSGGNVAKAARLCGVHRGYLFRLMKRHGIER